MSNEFQRDYLVRLPLPLAQLYGRAYNAKDGRGRHDSCFYLCEALIKLATGPLIVAYLDELRRDGRRVEALDRMLLQLALPSLGQWAGFLRELARHFGERPDAASHPLGHVWEQLNTQRRDLPGLLALFRRIKNGPEGQPAGDRSCSLLQLIDSLVQYRNAVFGHGAGRVASFYEDEMGPLLFPAVNEVLAEGTFDLLGPRGSKLVYLVDVKKVQEDRVEVGMRELVGLQSERMAPLILTSEQADGLLPGRVAVWWPGRKAPLPLDPLLVYRENELSEDVLFLNRDRNGRQVEYLSYCTGQTERDKTMVPAMARMLSAITGDEVTEERLEQLRETSLAETISVEALTGTSKPATRVLGDFAILTELGRGGMGVVYLARQLSLGRLVALKMLPADMAGDDVALARFRREMRALGRCEHANIVKVLSNGTLPDGQLYYVMEYVPGADLEQTWNELAGTNRTGGAKTLGGTTWRRAILTASGKTREKSRQKTSAARPEKTVADKTAKDDIATEIATPVSEVILPPLPELPSHEDDPGGYVRRVATMIRDAARALQSVHDQNIVHRDIKPANLMLTPDGSRVVLMDFGLAKSDDMSLTASHSAGFLGTLRYSAPEQLAAAQLKVGPAADVRALGITMWELLTRERLFGEAEDERQLSSWVLGRDVPPLRTIDPTLDADLEAIVARATERGEEHRLQSAREMADYLDLYLQGKPIPIRMPGLVELAQRWVREHAAVAATAVAAFLAITITVIVAFVFITRSRNDAIIARNASDKRLELAKRAVFEMLTEVGSETLNDVPQMEGIRKDLLNKALSLYEQIGKTSNATDETTRFQTAMANFEVAQIHHQIGTGKNAEIAETAYEQAISQLDSLATEFKSDSTYQQELARSHMWLGELLREVEGRIREAERHSDKAIAIQNALTSRDVSRIQYQIDLARSHMNRGNTRDAGGQIDPAMSDYDKAVELLTTSIERQPTDEQHEECHVLLAKCHSNSGVLLRSQLNGDNADPQLAERTKAAYLKAIDELQTVIDHRRRSNQSVRLEYNLDLAKYHNNLANLLNEHFGDRDEAEKHNQEAVRLAEALNVGTRETRVDLANFYNTKGLTLYEANPDLAIAEWQSAAKVLETIVHENKKDEEATELLGMILCNICEVYQIQQKHDEAIRSIDRLVNLACEKSRFTKATKLMEAGRDEVQDRNLADKYEAKIIRLRRLASAADEK